VAESGRQHVRRQSSAYAPANRGSGESEEGPDRSTDGAAEPRPSRPGDRGGTARPAGLLRNNDLADLWGGAFDLVRRPESLFLFRRSEARQRLAPGPHRTGSRGIGAHLRFMTAYAHAV